MDSTHPTSAGTTIVNSQPPSRAASVKHPKAPSMQQEDEFDEPPPKDRAPPFVVILCLFQSLAGLLFGWESGGIAGVVNQADCAFSLSCAPRCWRAEPRGVVQTR